MKSLNKEKLLHKIYKIKGGKKMSLLEKINKPLNRKIFIPLLFLIGISTYADKTLGKGSGSISKVSANYTGIIVKGESSDREDWLGCTVFYEGRSSDKRAIKVSGDFTERFNPYVGTDVADKYTVALWDKKILESNCKGEPGSDEVPGPYCQRNGYHLEDELDRDSGYIGQF